MANRKFKEIGLEPIFAYLLLAGIFIGLSVSIYERTEFAKYILLILALFLISKCSEIKRNEFLKLCYSEKKYKRIRLSENLLISVPFILFFIYKGEFICSLLLFFLASTLALLNFKTSLNIVIPTPFSKKPFEFCVGFRKSFYFYFVAYGLTIISIIVDNFNLGIFGLLSIFLIVLTYYSKPEKEYFVWNFNRSPESFLMKKMKIGIKYSLSLALPIYIALLFFNFQKIGILSLFLIIGLAFIIYIITAKYAYYPDEINLIQTIFLVLSILFPPLLIILIPYFYAKAKNRLNTLLE